MTSIERELQSIRSEMRRLSGALPLLLTFKQAARELSISVSKLKQMKRAGIIQTVQLEPKGHPRIPVAEITRLASRSTDGKHPRSPRPQRPTVASGGGKATRDAVRAKLRRGRLKDR